jgi:hypothetical protein
MYPYVGGIVGETYGVVTNCYYTPLEKTTYSKGTMLTIEQMYSEDSFEGFDFDTIWYFADEGEGFSRTQMQQSFLEGLEAGRPKWHKRLERPKEKINALCFDIEQNKFILGFYDLEADEWLRYGGYETINIDLWTKIEIPEFIKE